MAPQQFKNVLLAIVARLPTSLLDLANATRLINATAVIKGNGQWTPTQVPAGPPAHRTSVMVGVGYFFAGFFAFCFVMFLIARAVRWVKSRGRGRQQNGGPERDLEMGAFPSKPVLPTDLESIRQKQREADTRKLACHAKELAKIQQEEIERPERVRREEEEEATRQARPKRVPMGPDGTGHRGRGTWTDRPGMFSDGSGSEVAHDPQLRQPECNNPLHPNSFLPGRRTTREN
ncbi:hypothetical protein G7Y89_g13191 [Cudoniella acicularis]|uniref:Uncharacterized protein n=1 Tax=Cudoniella acicularis TaxID=354080 RepID=A0A8H4VYH3_9HELO|nr:hypothetical protein G7Y89_g13191 [Cudoniella acicularis]